MSFNLSALVVLADSVVEQVLQGAALVSRELPLNFTNGLEVRTVRGFTLTGIILCLGSAC